MTSSYPSLLGDVCHLCYEDKLESLKKGIGVIYLPITRTYCCETCFRSDPVMRRHYREIFYHNRRLEIDESWLKQIKRFEGEKTKSHAVPPAPPPQQDPASS